MNSFDPFATDHPGGYLADSQFDYPLGGKGWQFLALTHDDAMAPFTPNDAFVDTAAPYAYLVSDDPYARIGRDWVHPGHSRKPCLHWSAEHEGVYRLEGDIALIRSDAHGRFEVRVIIDGVDVLVKSIDFPQELRFAIDAPVRRGGFIRVVFRSTATIDGNEALHYLRIRRADASLPPYRPNVTCSCAAADSWERLGQLISMGADAGSPGIGHLSRTLFDARCDVDPMLMESAQAGVRTHFSPQFGQFRKPRFFLALQNDGREKDCPR
jgi:hypothetical protein